MLVPSHLSSPDAALQHRAQASLFSRPVWLCEHSVLPEQDLSRCPSNWSRESQHMVDGNSMQRLAKILAVTSCVVLLFCELVSSKPLARELLSQTAHIPNLRPSCPNVKSLLSSRSRRGLPVSGIAHRVTGSPASPVPGSENKSRVCVLVRVHQRHETAANSPPKLKPAKPCLPTFRFPISGRG
jgi:hypothetical protein